MLILVYEHLFPDIPTRTDQIYYDVDIEGLTGVFPLLRNSVLLFCESSCLFYLSFNFDFYVSSIMHL